MPLDKQIISIPFTGGLDTKTDEKLVQSGSVTDIINGVYTKINDVGKRNGFDAVTSSILGGGSLPTTKKLAARLTEKLAISSSNLYSYSSTEDKWVNKGSASNVTVKSLPISENATNPSASADIVISNGVKYFAWWSGSNNSLYVSCIDSASGTQFLSSVIVATNAFFNFRLLSIGSFVYLIYNEASAGVPIRYLAFNSSSPLVIPSPVTFDTHSDTGNNNIDALPYLAGGVIAYFDSVSFAAPRIIVSKVAANLAGLATFTQAAGPHIQGLSVAVDSSNNNVYVTYIEENGGVQTLKYFVIDQTFGVQVLAPTVLPFDGSPYILKQISTIVESANTLRIFSDTYRAYTVYGFVITISTIPVLNTFTATVGGVVSSVLKKRSLVLGSKPFIYNGNTYVMVGTSVDSLDQDTYYLMDKNGVLVSKALFERGFPQFASSVIQISSGVFSISGSYIIKITNSFLITTEITYAITGISEVTFDFVSNIGQRTVESNNLTLISGGYPQIYDGARTTEHGFLLFPDKIGVKVTSPGGALQLGPGGADSQYGYAAIYKWYDAQGNEWESAPSPLAIAQVTAANSQAEVSVPILSVTDKINVSIFIYRTIQNGTTPYLVAIIPNVAAGGGNDDYAVFNDTFVTDDAIQSNEILYTTGGVLDNLPPPPYNHNEVFANRIIISDLEDGTRFSYSKEIASTEGISFNDAFEIRIDESNKRIYGTKKLDDKLIISKDSQIYAMTGSGPDDTGSNNDFTIPQLISSDVGSAYPDSWITMPNGVLMKTYKGIYLLERSLSVSYLGAPAELYNGETISGAALMQTVNQVRFLTTTGRSLIYDYLLNKWGTNNYTGIHALLLGGVYHFINGAGTIYQENLSSYGDGGVAIPLTIVSPWIKVNAMEGYQRVRRAAILGNYYNPHILTVKVYYDYNNSVFDTYTFNTATGLVGLDNVYQFRIHLKKQKCEAIKFSVDDSVTATTTRNFSLNDITIEVGLKKGLDKLPAYKSVG